LFGSLCKVDHVDDVADEIDLESTPAYRCDIDSLDDTAEDLCCLGATIRSVEGLIQVFDLAPIEFCEIGMKDGSGRSGIV
jgi:hypothetical protein